MECIETGWIFSDGPFVKRVEEGFAAGVGRRFGIAISNGSAALGAAVVALGTSLKKGAQLVHYYGSYSNAHRGIAARRHSSRNSH